MVFKFLLRFLLTFLLVSAISAYMGLIFYLFYKGFFVLCAVCLIALFSFGFTASTWHIR